MFGRYRTEDDFCESATRKRFVGNSADYFQGVLYDCQGEMCSIIHEAGNVLFGHLGKLLLENILHAGEDNGAVFGGVIVDDTDFDFTVAFFDYGGLRGTSETAGKAFVEARRTFSGNGTIRIIFLVSLVGRGSGVEEYLVRFAGLSEPEMPSALRLVVCAGYGISVGHDMYDPFY